jgi:hypothetical protein
MLWFFYPAKFLETLQDFSTTALAQIEMEILLLENLYFLELAERPTEAPDGS